MTRLPLLHILSLTAFACAIPATAADSPRAKDIVLTSLAKPPAPATPASNYGMSVSVLISGHDGLLTPRSTEGVFRTGDKFRLRVLPTRDGTIVISNTDPKNQTRELLRLPVRGGLETLVPAEPDNLFQLVGEAGDDVLHLQLFPSNLPQPAQGALLSKDIRLVTQSTGSASYVVGETTQPIYTRIVVRHQN